MVSYPFPGAFSFDHWSFWKVGYPALMATDTGPLRYCYYHSAKDTTDKINFEWLARVTQAAQNAVNWLCNPRR